MFREFKMLKNSLKLISSSHLTLRSSCFSTSTKLNVCLSGLSLNKTQRPESGADLSASDVIFSKNTSTQKAESVSRAMAYYLDKVSKRGSQNSRFFFLLT